MQKVASIDGILYRTQKGRQCYIGEEYKDGRVLIFYKSDGKQMFSNRDSLKTEEEFLKQRGTDSPLTPLKQKDLKVRLINKHK